jgi:two-component system NarL family sensor kinase
MSDARPEAERRIDSAIDQLHLAIRDIRNFIYGLRPEAVDGTEVVAGIAALAHDFRDGGLVDVVATLDPQADPELSADDGVELLSLVREALSNAARHAHAHRVDVVLGTGKTGSWVEIADDGVGFDAARDPGEAHQGLKNMRVRAEAIGAHLTISSEPGAGTRIRVDFLRGPT